MRRLPLLLVLGVCLGASARCESVAVTGKVVDQAGQPVAGADVWTAYYDDTGRHRVTAVTDQRGAFRLEWRLDRPQTVHLLAMAPGLAVTMLPFDPADPQPLLFRLPPEARTRGVVKDDQGEPVAGAQVLLRSFTPAGGRPDDFEAHVFLAPECPIRTAADAQGRFEIGSVPKGASVELMVEADGFARWTPWMPSRSPEAVAGADQDYSIALERGAIVTGAVARDGAPVAGVRVMAQGVGEGNGWDEATSDEQGRYRLARLGHGTYNIMVDRAGDLIAPARPDVSVSPGDQVDGIDFALTPGGVIEGRVVDADTGAPITGVRVASYGPARPQSSAACISVLVDANGVYQMRVASGSNYVYYQSGSDEYPYSRDASFDLDVAEGQTAKAPDLKVKRVEPLTVLVVDEAGRPVPGARLEWGESYFPHTETGADGRCEARGLLPGQPVVFVARDADGKLCGAATVKAVDPERPLTVIVQPAATIVLCFVDADGNPLAGIGAQASLSVEVWELNPIGGAWEPGASTRLASVESDDEGLVRFAGLPAGTAPKFGVDTQTDNRVEWPTCPVLTPGLEQILGEVMLDIRKLPIHGTVVLADETPVKGAFVRTAEWGASEVRTDEQGRFTIAGLLPSEEVVVLAASPDRKLLGAEKVVPSWELEPAIVLIAPVGVRGLLAGPDGTALADRKVQLLPATGGRAEGFPLSGETKTDQDGAFAFEPVVAGVEYHLVASDAEGRLSRIVLTFVVEPGAEVDLGPVTAKGE